MDDNNDANLNKENKDSTNENLKNAKGNENKNFIKLMRKMILFLPRNYILIKIKKIPIIIRIYFI